MVTCYWAEAALQDIYDWISANEAVFGSIL
jgi:hypothetical protein